MTQGTTSAPAIGAASAGLRYQVRCFWPQALPMLYDSQVAKVVVEHRDVDAIDDVVVYYAVPGINDGGTKINVDFNQLKYHVAQNGLVDHDTVINPDWTGTKEPLLKRFCDAWLGIRSSHPNARLNLVTNWPWSTASPVRPHLRDGGRLDAAFLAKSARTNIGKIRADWQAVCGIGDDEFRAFASALRFATSAVSQGEAESWLRDRCQLAGLIPIDPAVDWSPYDDLGKRLIENGRTEHTPESLRRLVEKQGLVRQNVPPFRSTFAVRSFRRFAYTSGAEGAHVVDLTDLFDDRYPINDGVWAGEIRDRLLTAISAAENLAQPIHVALDAHLSIAWYVGSLFNPKCGITVKLRQRVKGEPVQLWDVSSPLRPDGAPEWLTASETLGDGSDFAIVVSVTHDALEDAKRTISMSLPTIGTVLHLKLPKVGPASILDGGHARWLADELVRKAATEIAKLRPTRIHLFPATPSSLMFLVGQEAVALGPTTVYEFPFGDPSRIYLPGMSS